MITQLGLSVLSLLALALVSSDGRWRRWASIPGLASQPFWLHQAWTHGEWGMMVVVGCYTLIWTKRLHKEFIR